ncbi:uncharacterized protein LOC124553346 [Schistocerca americana]|uniref:uncharacterized protein LOC124553346 n=1 Tax=Schistocerca americana TaxID=7009 RepID=UPI001F5024A2|nr:uncharacterized protein LOC124553346 [Schistocerca americana]
MSPPSSPPTSLPPIFVPGFHNEAAVRAMCYNPLGETSLYTCLTSAVAAASSAANMGASQRRSASPPSERPSARGSTTSTRPLGTDRAAPKTSWALKEVPRQAYYIGTKVGSYELHPHHMFDFSASKTRQSIEKSLKLLQLDYVDILQVHDVEFAPDSEMVINETLPVVKEAVEAGKARFIGITGYPVSALKDIITRSKDIRISTVLSYCRDTLVDSTLQEYMPFFKSQGVELGKLAVYHALTREGQATHIVGANCREVLHLNLRTLREGLTEAERQVLEHVKDRFFADLKVRHWEGKELRERAENEKLEEHVQRIIDDLAGESLQQQQQQQHSQSTSGAFCSQSQGVELGKLAVYHALTREGQATHIVGANCREVLHLNLRTLREGQVLEHVRDR